MNDVPLKRVRRLIRASRLILAWCLFVAACRVHAQFIRECCCDVATKWRL